MRTARTIFLVMFLCLASLSVQAQSLDSVLARLRSDTATERVAALRQLARMDADLRAFKPLLDALGDSSPDVRLEALKTWGVVGPAYDDAIIKAYTPPKSASMEKAWAAREAW